MMVSKYIGYREATKSQTAIRHNISNVPTAQQLDAMRNVAKNVFDPVREHFGVPIGVSSFFRNSALNSRIGGSPTSQHRTGEAIDIDADIYGGITNQQIYEFIRDNLEFDQLISEFGSPTNPAWVHVSLKMCGTQRKQLIRAQNKSPRYILWH